MRLIWPLWVMIVLETTALFLISPSFIQNTVGSPQVAFGTSIIPFSIVFVGWFATICILIFLRRHNLKLWEGVLLSALLGIVFFNYWTTFFPFGRYGEQNIFVANSLSITKLGHVESSLCCDVNGGPSYPYLEFPGLALLLAVVSMVTNVQLTLAPNILLLVNSALLPTLFLFLLRTFPISPLYQMLGVFFATEGNEFMSRSFFLRPEAGFTIAVFTLALLALRIRGGPRPRQVIVLICVAVLTFSHIMDALVLSAVILGIVVMTLRLNGPKVVTPAIALAVVLASAIWPLYNSFVYASIATFEVANTFSQIFAGIFLHYNLLVLGSNLGGSVSAGGELTRLFWLVLVYLFGTLASLTLISKKRNTCWHDPLLWGSLVSLILFSVMTVVLSISSVALYVEYSIFFVTPPLLGTLEKLSSSRSLSRIRLNAARFNALLMLVLIVLALPSFMFFSSTLSIDGVYPHNVAGGEFVGKWYQQDSVTVAGSITDTSLVQVVSYNARLSQSYGTFSNKSDYYTYLNTVLLGHRSTPDSIVMLSNSLFSATYHLYGANPDDPGYQSFVQKLNSQYNRVYDDKFLSVLFSGK